MSANWHQIFVANPTTTFQSNDVFYLARNPYGASDDYGFTYSSLIPVNTKGDLFTWSTGAAKLGVGANGTILTPDSAQATGLKWTTATYPATTTINQILYSSANNTIAGLTTDNQGILGTNATGVPSIIAPAVNGDGFIVQSTLAGAPAWSSCTYPSSCNKGDIIYASTLQTLETLAGNNTPSTTKFLSQAANGLGAPQDPAWISVPGENAYVLCQQSSGMPTNGINLNDPTVAVGIGILPTDPTYGLAELNIYNNSATSSDGYPLNIVSQSNGGNVSCWITGYTNIATNMVNLSTITSRGTIASPAAIQSGDIIFAIDNNGQYSTSTSNYSYCASIQTVAAANFTSTTNHQTILKFLTSNSGDASPVERVRIDNTGLLTAYNGISTTTLNATSSVTSPLIIGGNAVDSALELRSTSANGTTDYIKFTVDNNGSIEAMRISPGGRVLINTTSPRADLPGSISAQMQLEGTTAGSSSFSTVRNSNDGGAPFHYFGKSRGTTNGSVTIVQADDDLGSIRWTGADGTGLINSAELKAEVDGTPGTNDMPGRLVFSTTAAGASTVTERMRIDKAGNVVVNTAAIATTATDGFLYIPTCAGAPSGVPTTYTGSVAMVFDTTNNKLCIYDGAWLSVTLA